jgi:hypothetical protein
MGIRQHASTVDRGGGRAQKTLDLEHSNVLLHLESERKRLATMRVEMAAAEAKIRQLQSRDKASMSDDDFDALTKACDMRDRLAVDIEECEATSDEVAYYARTANILFKYYDIIEKGNVGASHTTPTAIPASQTSILKYFAAPPPATPSATDSPSAVPADDRAGLLERYLQSAWCEGPTRHIMDVQPATAGPPKTGHASSRGGHGEEMMNAARAHEADACMCCGRCDRTVLLQEGYVFCKGCHTVEYILVDHDKPSYKDPPKEIAYFAYKRINHLNEWINQVQGKETTDIPDDVFDSILVEIKKQKLTNMADLTGVKVKGILKKLRINKYYEHVPHIINRLNGMPSPHMSPELEDRLRHMFCMIQLPFVKHSPSTRKNFLSYSYCLHKMLQLLEKDQYLDSFPLLKSREKLHHQDQIWKKICDDVGWDFIPSL